MSLEVNDDLLAPTQPTINLDVMPPAIHWLNLVNVAIHTSEYLYQYTQACYSTVSGHWKTPQRLYPNPYSQVRDMVSNYDAILNSPQCPEYLSTLIKEFKDCTKPYVDVTLQIINSAYNMAGHLVTALHKEYTKKHEEFRASEYAGHCRPLERRYLKRPNHNFPSYGEFRDMVCKIINPPTPPAIIEHTADSYTLLPPHKVGSIFPTDSEHGVNPPPTPTVTPTNEIITTITEYIKTNQDTIVKVAEAAKLIHALLNPKPKIPVHQVPETKSAF